MSTDSNLDPQAFEAALAKYIPIYTSEDLPELKGIAGQDFSNGARWARSWVLANDPVVRAMAEALAWYANRENWERIEGHTKWASNLNAQDCAMLNCGGGRARLAIAAYRESVKGGG